MPGDGSGLVALLPSALRIWNVAEGMHGRSTMEISLRLGAYRVSMGLLGSRHFLAYPPPIDSPV